MTVTNYTNFTHTGSLYGGLTWRRDLKRDVHSTGIRICRIVCNLTAIVNTKLYYRNRSASEAQAYARAYWDAHNQIRSIEQTFDVPIVSYTFADLYDVLGKDFIDYVRIVNDPHYGLYSKLVIALAERIINEFPSYFVDKTKYLHVLMYMDKYYR